MTYDERENLWKMLISQRQDDRDLGKKIVSNDMEGCISVFYRATHYLLTKAINESLINGSYYEAWKDLIEFEKTLYGEEGGNQKDVDFL